jgi:sarcosine oxidase subunit gamma
MPEGPPRESPLACHALGLRAAGDAGKTALVLSELRGRACITLRGSPTAELRHAIAENSGCGLPLNPHEATAHGGMAALWLGPDEWLITGAAKGPALATALQRAVRAQFASVTDVTDAWCIIRLCGPAAREALSKGCRLDLHPRVFRRGHVTRTLLAQATIILHQTGDNAYDIFVGRSYADYLWQWLEDASKEFGTEISD